MLRARASSTRLSLSPTRPCRRAVGARWELSAALNRLPREAFPVLIQERIVGAGLGVFLLRHAGRTEAAFAHRRLREKPPSGGVSVLAEAVELPPALLERAERLLDCFGWNGVAMVEFKEDAATGEPVLMEVNGRFWGSLQLAIDSGVDFPSRLVALAAGGPAGLPDSDLTLAERSPAFGRPRPGSTGNRPVVHPGRWSVGGPSQGFVKTRYFQAVARRNRSRS